MNLNEKCIHTIVWFQDIQQAAAAAEQQQQLSNFKDSDLRLLLSNFCKIISDYYQPGKHANESVPCDAIHGIAWNCRF